MTSIEEIKIAKNYVLNRQLVRPKTNILNAIFFLFFLLLVNISLSFLLKLIIHISFFVIFYVLLFLSIIIFLKKILIGIVELYQHYTPESYRRSCLCMPTCSEYMILALNKFGVFIGIKKGLYRLIYVCRGFEYKIDYP